MKLVTLQALPSLLLVNWPIVLGLVIWVFVVTGVVGAGLFVVIWVALDKLWDITSGKLIMALAAVGANENEALWMRLAGEVPARMAAGMIVDLVGTLLIPWLVAAYFLAGGHG